MGAVIPITAPTVRFQSGTQSAVQRAAQRGDGDRPGIERAGGGTRGAAVGGVADRRAAASEPVELGSGTSTQLSVPLNKRPSPAIPELLQVAPVITPLLPLQEESCTVVPAPSSKL